LAGRRPPVSRPRAWQRFVICLRSWMIDEKTRDRTLP
ncbi:uncharacterized protein METZ01_LOCUS241098, partial [marine metagenome]